VRDAAQQFESLLLDQILRAAREGGSGWLGAEKNSAGDCATEYAEQQFAVALAQRGGLGLANLVVAGLEKK
jgi:Rod binding domain-containing protein